jgi:ATP-dependent helicase HrpB
VGEEAMQNLLRDLPVADAIDELKAALGQHRNAVLVAPPGAGKSTGVPLALLDASWLGGGTILMLEPRRLATRRVAARMAWMLGERVGGTVGYRMRMDTRVGPRSRIEVVTEGILTRRLQRDPALEGVALVVFDEFHERNLQADLGLALALDAQRHLRPELRILVMSATLDGAAVAALLGGAPVVRSEGRSFPVQTSYAARASDDPVERRAAAAIGSALRDQPGDMLVFLPGAGEIRRTLQLLENAALDAAIRVLPLYGDLSQQMQDEAIHTSEPGRRKIVLATNIAETSLTIEGIRVVVDSGLERRPRFDPASGMSSLQTVRISRASADQRRGRAGRLGPGVCLRLWTETQHRALADHAPAEIVEADLAPLALELACWGTTDPLQLAWLDPPPAGALSQARELLRELAALDESDRITGHGREMATLGVHPRLAHMLLKGKAAGEGTTACALAALLTERDLLAGRAGERDADIRTRLEMLSAGRIPEAADAVPKAVSRAVSFFQRQLGVAAADDVHIDVDAAGWLLAKAYPDRIGRCRAPRTGRYQLTSGPGAFFAGAQALSGSEFLVIPELDAGEREARIFTAAPITRRDIEEHFAAHIIASEHVWWDSREQAARARRQHRLWQLVLSDAPLSEPDPRALIAAVMVGIRELGLEALPWDQDLRMWQARVLFARYADTQAKPPWPDVSDAALLATLETWLAPWLSGITRREQFCRIDLEEALQALLDWSQRRRLDELAPTHVVVPSGSRIAIDYTDSPVPSLSVRLQEVFGLRETPRVGGGRVPLLLKLLSPARRPVQVTQDLQSFWQSGYHEVKKELKGRYPKHYWPDDPWQARPTRRVRPR